MAFGTIGDYLILKCLYILASSVLRMIFSAYQGTIEQKSLLSNYLKKYEDGTTRPADLWEFFKTNKSLDGNVYENIAEMMDTWTNQPGYPIVHAELNDSTLTLTQVGHYVGQARSFTLCLYPNTFFHSIWKLFDFMSHNMS